MNTSFDKVVVLIQVSEHLPFNQRPHILDYENEHILHIFPCFKTVDGAYADLRTGKKMKKTENMEEWNVLTGTVFQYPDNKKFLISRRYADRQLLVLETDEVRSTMILRKVK